MFYLILSIILNISPNFACKYGFNGDYCDECGKTYSQPNLRIVGGKEANPYSWPSMAYIKFNYRTRIQIKENNQEIIKEFGFACGGSLIDRRTVLTAAHCIITETETKYWNKTYKISIKPNEYYPSVESMITVYLGLHNKSVIDAELIKYPVIMRKVSSIKRHEKFNNQTLENDIALLILDKEVELNEYIQLACLPQESPNYPGNRLDVYAVGWGLVDSYASEQPSNLRNVRLSVYDESYCEIYGAVKNSRICAGDLNGVKSVCKGDSGGPLFFKTTINSKPKYILVGITSYGSGTGCNVREKPNVYTRVSVYTNWIKFKGQELNANDIETSKRTAYKNL